ncbi:hypothetical protein H2199_004051 [Coniosporium tulheliwenetii]|uniref:Uncharacterized protein n=1 Tax=Coniosporium tulheliwenetii TaxID=3383036 RepID=A0ACC2Z7X8_9PEZI|nr:hypothetical protein H2199_004051 [Cladosporium sp. JES 115]
MSVPYESPISEEDTDFAHIRDSFYILTTMNQYSMKARASLKKEAEGLLRIVLFSKDLKMHTIDGSLVEFLPEARRELAGELREGPFGHLGENTTAHDLALGLLLGWLPVLILSSIVDRNPVAADDVRRKLNKLVDLVRYSLRDKDIRQDYIESTQNSCKSRREFDSMRDWIDRISQDSEYMDNFFTSFAGQGRVRWHYGAAHPILSDIEQCYVAERGRNWLADEEEARTSLVLGEVEEGLVWFDFRELWQIGSAIIIVSFTCFGAFVISFYTPTVGLGCRSGGYMVFCSISAGLLICELLVWWLASPVRLEKPQALVRLNSRLQSNAMVVAFEDSSCSLFQKLTSRIAQLWLRIVDGAIRAVIGVVAWRQSPDRRRRVEERMRTSLEVCRDYTLKEWTERFFFRPIELINAAWLLYIVMAQTFGWYKNCNCVTSTWGGRGGYLDFTQSDVTNSPWVLWYWTSGTVLASTTMGLAMIYIIAEVGGTSGGLVVRD